MSMMLEITVNKNQLKANLKKHVVVKGKYFFLLDMQLSCYLAYWANSMLNSRFLNTMLYLFKSPQKFSGVHGTIHGHHFKSISCQLGN